MSFDAPTTAFTITWWERLLRDDVAMANWLVKLHRTEFEGYQDNIDAALKWAPETDSAANLIFQATGLDELRHSEMLEPILHVRGLTPYNPGEGEPSIFWEKMGEHVVSLETCAAVLHIGEQLAANRFEVLLAHEGTPSDIRLFLKNALPDESYHARSFGKLAGEDAVREIGLISQGIVESMKNGRT